MYVYFAFAEHTLEARFDPVTAGNKVIIWFNKEPIYCNKLFVRTHVLFLEAVGGVFGNII